MCVFIPPCLTFSIICATRACFTAPRSFSFSPALALHLLPFFFFEMSPCHVLMKDTVPCLSNENAVKGEIEIKSKFTATQD